VTRPTNGVQPDAPSFPERMVPSSAEASNAAAAQSASAKPVLAAAAAPSPEPSALPAASTAPKAHVRAPAKPRVPGGSNPADDEDPLESRR